MHRNKQAGRQTDRLWGTTITPGTAATDLIETDEGDEETEVRLGELVPHKVPLPGQDPLAPVQRREELPGVRDDSVRMWGETYKYIDYIRGFQSVGQLHAIKQNCEMH